MDPILEALSAVLQSVLAGCCLLLVCGLPPAAIGVVYFTLGTRPQNAKIGQLAEQMGMRPVDPKRGRRFEAAHQGHAYTIGRGIGGYYAGGRRHYSPALSVHVELATTEPLRGRVGRSDGPAKPDDTFESAFRQEAPIERLSPAGRAAMLTFARSHGNLWLEAFRPETTPRLEHTLGSISETTPESLRAVLDDLVEVARVIETTVP